MPFNIPLFKLNYNDDENKAVMDVIASRWISMGEKTALLEQKFCKLLNSPYALAVTNCTAALHLAMILENINPGDEVIVPSLTFVATVNAVRYVGATPVFCDIVSTENLTISPDAIREKITENTKAVVVMHYAGFGCDMPAIKAICGEYGVSIIEDACHGPFSMYEGECLGTIGDIGCFSFFSNKNISTGEGGLLTFKKEEHYNRAKLLRSHGMTSLSYERSKGHITEYDVIELGYNYRIDDIRSCLALEQIKKIPADYEKRKNIRNLYIQILSQVKGIIIPFMHRTDFVSNYIFPIVLSGYDRGEVRDYLHQKGIQTSIHYPAVHRFSTYSDSNVKLPVTEYVSDNLITLPMYADLSEDEVKYICNCIKEALSGLGWLR